MRTALLGATCGGALVLGATTALGATTGAGSSFARVAYQNWCQSIGCSYNSTGSGAGLTSLGAKTVDFAGSDAIPTAAQLQAIQSAGGGSQPLFFPTLLGGISVPVNVDGLKGRLRLDGNTLGRIFDGEISTWNDPAIKKQNPGQSLPSAPITVCVRSDASGTSFGFSRYLTKVSPSFKEKVNFSQTPPWTAPHLQKGPQNPGVANCIKSNSNSIGYVDLADANNAGLAPQIAAIGKSQTVKVKKGNKTVSQRKTVYLVPNANSIEAAGNIKSFPANLLVDPSASPVPGAYPIVITTWVVTYGNYAGTGKDAAGVKQFLNYAYGKGQSTLVSLGYAKLPSLMLSRGKAQIAKIKG
jgi:phosphate transport system substrate-binding protein